MEFSVLAFIHLRISNLQIDAILCFIAKVVKFIFFHIFFTFIFFHIFYNKFNLEDSFLNATCSIAMQRKHASILRSTQFVIETGCEDKFRDEMRAQRRIRTNLRTGARSLGVGFNAARAPHSNK